MDADKVIKRPWIIFGSRWKKEDQIKEDDGSKTTDIKTEKEDDRKQECDPANQTQNGESRNLKCATDTKSSEKSTSPKKILALIFALVVFMVICALIFSVLERTNEREQMKFWNTVKQELVSQFNLSDKELLQLMVRVDGIKKYGLEKTRWDFYNSFWFTMTITTTIGFGHITPVTTAGRLFCILCGLFGIPLNALVLKHVGVKIRIWTTKSIQSFETRCLGRTKCKDVEIKCACATFFFMVLFLLLGSCLDLIFDGWTIADGIYFNFIALSTIGFGDIYPTVNKPSKLDDLGLSVTQKKFLASGVMIIYLTIGLAIVSSVVVSILNALNAVEKAKRKIVTMRKHSKSGTGSGDDNDEQPERSREISREEFGSCNEGLSFEETYGKIGETRF